MIVKYLKRSTWWLWVSRQRASAPGLLNYLYRPANARAANKGSKSPAASFTVRWRDCFRGWAGPLAILLAAVGFSVGPRVMAQSLPINTKLGGPFELASTRAGVQGIQDFAGKVVLLNFGYTSCPDVCPMVLARLSQLHKQLGAAASEVQTAFVTVDPDTDTVDKLTDYLRFFNEDFVGFSGAEPAIAKVAKQYGVVYMEEPPSPSGQPRFGHSDFVYLLDRQGRLRKVYSTADSLQDMQRDIRTLINEGRSVWSRLFDVFE